MTPHRMIGIALLLAGIILFSAGLKVSKSVIDQLDTPILGRLIFLSGLLMASVGLIMAIFGGRVRRT